VVGGPDACIFSLCSEADVSKSHVTCSEKTYTLFLKKNGYWNNVPSM
jgi:hypothetical protein